MTTTDTIPTIEREIKYSRQDRDYACYVNGQYIGSCANYSDGEALCNQVAYDLLMDGQCATATELDGGSEPDAMAADHAVVAPACDPIITCEDDDCTDDAMHIVAGAKLCCWHFAEATGYVCDYSGDHVDTCYVCGSAAWELTVHGPLCPSHAAAYNEWQGETNPPILAPDLLAEVVAPAAACSSANPCDNPNHNHSAIYTAPLAEADRALSTCPGALGNLRRGADSGRALGH